MKLLFLAVLAAFVVLSTSALATWPGNDEIEISEAHPTDTAPIGAFDADHSAIKTSLKIDSTSPTTENFIGWCGCDRSKVPMGANCSNCSCRLKLDATHTTEGVIQRLWYTASGALSHMI